MKIKKVLILLCLSVFLVSFVPFGSVIKADEGYGVIITEQGEMYRDTHGNLFPIIVINGKKEVKLSQYELAPLEALLERDAKESKGESALPDELLKKFYSSGNELENVLFTLFTLPQIYSYNQRYKGWGSELLGFGPDTISESGCFLTSCAMMLATYNLTINGSIVNLLNLNNWLKGHNGFSGDLLIFGALANFPGIHSVGYCDNFEDALILIYYHIIPILAMNPPHFSPLVKTNGVRDKTTNWIMNTYWSGHYSYDYNNPGGLVYSPYDNVPYYQTVQASGYDFVSSSVFRYACPD